MVPFVLIPTVVRNRRLMSSRPVGVTFWASPVNAMYTEVNRFPFAVRFEFGLRKGFTTPLAGKLGFPNLSVLAAMDSPVPVAPNRDLRSIPESGKPFADPAAFLNHRVELSGVKKSRSRSGV